MVWSWLLLNFATYFRKFDWQIQVGIHLYLCSHQQVSVDCSLGFHRRQFWPKRKAGGSRSKEDGKEDMMVKDEWWWNVRALSGGVSKGIDQKLIIRVPEVQVLQEDVVMTHTGTDEIHPMQKAKSKQLPLPDRRSLPTFMLLDQIVFFISLDPTTAHSWKKTFSKQTEHTEAFTQRIFTQRSFHTQTKLTPRILYPHKLLHIKAVFTQEQLLRTEQLLHAEAFTHRSF